MPSPFPGMNPYFEQPDIWKGFQTGFLVHLESEINRRLAPRYIASLEEHRYTDEPDEAKMDTQCDVPRSRRRGPLRPVAVAPMTTTYPAAHLKRFRWLKVHEPRNPETITMIAVISPAHKKPGQDRERYLARRRRILRSSANLVELDFLRGGERMPFDHLMACDYYALLSRVGERPRVGLWPFWLRDEMPSIPLPLRPGETEPTVPLKPVLDRVYDGGGYHYKLYDAPPDPPLAAADAAWAAAFRPATDPPVVGMGR